MLNSTFDSSEKSERRRRDRERQLELLAEASNGLTSSRDLPTFLDEDMIHLVRSNPATYAPDSRPAPPPRQSSSRSFGGVRESAVNIFPDGGGGSHASANARIIQRDSSARSLQSRESSYSSRITSPPRNRNNGDNSDSNLYDYDMCDAASRGGNSTDLDASPKSYKSSHSVRSEFSSPKSDAEEGEISPNDEDGVCDLEGGGKGRRPTRPGRGRERPRRTKQNSERFTKSKLDEGVHAPPLGLAESATQFLWEEEDQERGSVPMRGFNGETFEDEENDGIHIIGGNDEERVGRKGASVYGEGQELKDFMEEGAAIHGNEGRTRVGILGGNILKNLLPTFGSGRGDTGGGNHQVPGVSVGSRRGDSPGSHDPYGPCAHRSARSFRISGSSRKLGGPGARRGSSDSGGGGFNIAPRRFNDSLRSQDMDEVDLSLQGGGHQRRSIGHRSSASSSRKSLNVSTPYEYDGTYGFNKTESLSPLGKCATALKVFWNDCFLNRCLFNPHALQAGFIFCLILAAGLAIGYVEGEQDKKAQIKLGGPGSPGYTPEDLGRIEDVNKRIINSGATGHGALRDPEDEQDPTPQMLAAHWIALADPAKLDVDDEFLLQRYGLAVLFMGANGTNWNKREGWMTENGICSWHGIKCQPQSGRPDDEYTYDDNGEVIRLVLENNNLYGDFPEEVFTTLTELTVLDLNSNSLFGSIPDELGMVRGIETLDLGSNQLTGTLPSTTMRKLDELTNLDLSDNSLNGTVPATDLARLADTLTECSLFNNEFTGPVPSELGELTLLKSLYLDSNLLTGTVPSDMGNLKRMTDLRLRDNDLTGPLPPELSQIKTLEVLYLDSNHLSGTLHPSYSSLVRLEELHLYDNLLSGKLPASWGAALQDLQHLYLDGNALTGPIPSQWGVLRDMKHLFLNGNRLGGSLATELGKMEDLIKLRLLGNGFTGSIPTEFGKFLVLTHLNIENNRFRGTVPEELSKLVKMESLTAQGNDFSGSMPLSVCRLRKERALKELTASCLGQNARIKCECCTSCY